jgi:hypothetical protein
LFDGKEIDEATLKTNFEHIKTTTFNDIGKICKLFRLHKDYSVHDNLTNKQILGLLNSILEGFSISIKTNRKRVKKRNVLSSVNTYRLRIDNDIVEATNRRNKNRET